MVIEDPGIATLEVGGVFRSQTTSSRSLRLLQRGFAIKARRSGDQIVLTASPPRNR